METNINNKETGLNINNRLAPTALAGEEPLPGSWRKDKDGNLIPNDDATKLRHPELTEGHPEPDEGTEKKKKEK